MAYTYLIGWSKKNKYYYGVRYAKGCSPDELWRTYFTSSKHVEKFCKEHGGPDFLEIRREFNSVDAARDWEHKFLRRTRAKDRPEFLNETDNKAICREACARGSRNRDKAKIGAKTAAWFTTLSEEQRIALRAAKKKGMAAAPKWVKKKQGEGIRKYQKEAWSDPEIKSKRSASMRGPRKKVKCPHCSVIGGGGAMRQYHFDNCKMRTY